MGFDWDTRIYCILTINPIQRAYSDFQQLAHLDVFLLYQFTKWRSTLVSTSGVMCFPWCRQFLQGTHWDEVGGGFHWVKACPVPLLNFWLMVNHPWGMVSRRGIVHAKIMGVCWFPIQANSDKHYKFHESKGALTSAKFIVRPVINHYVFFVKQNNTLQPFGAWFFLWTWHVIEPVIYKFIYFMWIFECFQFWWFVRGCPSGKSTRISKITKFGSIDISRTKWFKMTFWFSIVWGHFTFPKGHSTIPQTGHNELVYEVFRTSRPKIHQCFISTSTKCSLPGCSRGHGIWFGWSASLRGRSHFKSYSSSWMVIISLPLQVWFAVDQPATKVVSYRWLIRY